MGKSYRLSFSLFLLVVPGTILLVWNLGIPPAFSTSAAPVSGPPADPRAEKVERIFAEIEEDYLNGRGGGKSYLLAEDEFNAYLLEKLREQNRKDVEKISVRLHDRVFTTHILVNMDEVQVRDTMTANLFKALFRGRQTIEVDGELKTNDGRGTYEVQRARVNDVGVPAVVVNTILSSVGRQQDPPFDPSEPFDIPYGIKTIRVQPGKVRIDT